MSGSLFGRLGTWMLALGAAGLLLYPSSLPDAAEASESLTEAPAMKVVIAGIVLFAIGSVMDFSKAHKTQPCRSCGKRSAVGSIFCANHKRELQLAAGRAGAQRVRD